MNTPGMVAVKPSAQMSQGALLSWPERYDRACRLIDAQRKQMDVLHEAMSELAMKGAQLEEENALLRQLAGPPWWVRLRITLARVCG